ncbi:MAG: sugar transferase [Bacteroides sp.]|nr:sugar transferase [Bacteroides sp.]
MKDRERKMRIVYILTDYLSTVVGLMAFTSVRFLMISKIYRMFSGIWSFAHSPGVKLTLAIFPIFMVGLYYLSGYYVNVTYKSRVREFLATLVSVSIGSLSFFMVVLLNDVLPERSMNYEVLLVFFLCLFVPVYVSRLLVTSLCIVNRRDSSLENIVVISGPADIYVQEMERVAAKSGKSVKSVVRVSSEDGMLPENVLTTARLSEELRVNDASAFAVALPSGDTDMYLRVLGALYPLDRPIYVNPDDYTLLVSKVTYDNLLSEPLVDISRSSLSDSVVSMKRAADVVGALSGLTITAPLFIVLAALIKLKSPGPVFYTQERVGYHRKPFKICKFRTMRVDAESAGPMLSSDDDPRVTSLGRVMRKYRLDELPNLWNVLRGDMSLVGPRPEREYFLKRLSHIAPHCALLHQVRPGLTSLGMVKFGYASNVEDMATRLKYDLLYIQNISVSLDLKVIFYTVRTIFRGEGK